MQTMTGRLKGSINKIVEILIYEASLSQIKTEWTPNDHKIAIVFGEAQS